MTLDADLLRGSFDLIVNQRPDITTRFYELLFEKYPQAEPLFAPSRKAQQAKMLTEALAAVLDHLDDAPWLEQTLMGLGQRHVEYGVTPEMYAWVGDALLTTLAEAAGHAWSNAVSEAWSEAYHAISNLMLRGAAVAA